MFLLGFLVVSLIDLSLPQPNNLIHFGPPVEPKSAEYYMAPNSPYPMEELRRTPRSFWKKLFKNGLFGDRTCNYDAGDRSSIVSSFPPFQTLQQWSPFQSLPLFSNCQRCTCTESPSYNYGNEQTKIPNNYNENDNSNNAYVSKKDESEMEKPSDMEDNVNNPPYTVPSSYLTYNNENSVQSQVYESKGNDYSKKLPQIFYQPIIYVSPQFQEHANSIFPDNCNLNKNAEPSKYSLLPSDIMTGGIYDSNPAQIEIPLTLDIDIDQPYRVCPELFEDYNRRLSKCKCNNC